MGVSHRSLSPRFAVPQVAAAQVAAQTKLRVSKSMARRQSFAQLSKRRVADRPDSNSSAGRSVPAGAAARAEVRKQYSDIGRASAREAAAQSAEARGRSQRRQPRQKRRPATSSRASSAAAPGRAARAPVTRSTAASLASLSLSRHRASVLQPRPNAEHSVTASTKRWIEPADEPDAGHAPPRGDDGDGAADHLAPSPRAGAPVPAASPGFRSDAPRPLTARRAAAFAALRRHAEVRATAQVAPEQASEPDAPPAPDAAHSLPVTVRQPTARAADIGQTQAAVLAARHRLAALSMVPISPQREPAPRRARLPPSLVDA